MKQAEQVLADLRKYGLTDEELVQLRELIGPVEDNMPQFFVNTLLLLRLKTVNEKLDRIERFVKGKVITEAPWEKA